jgi:hypothetical protein
MSIDSANQIINLSSPPGTHLGNYTVTTKVNIHYTSDLASPAKLSDLETAKDALGERLEKEVTPIENDQV